MRYQGAGVPESLTDLRAICDELKQRVSLLTALLVSKETERRVTLEDVRDLRERNAELQGVITLKEDQAKQREVELSDVRCSLSAMSATSSKLEAKVVQLAAALDVKDTEQRGRDEELAKAREDLNMLLDENVLLKEKLVHSEAETKKLLADLHKLTVNRLQLQSVAEAAAQQKIAHLEDRYMKILRRLKARVDDDPESEPSMISKVDSTFTQSRIGVDISDSEKIRHISFGSCRLLFRTILPGPEWRLANMITRNSILVYTQAVTP